MEISDEELLAPSQKPVLKEVVFNITREEAVKFLKSHIRTYEQFDSFPPEHPATHKSKWAGAVYRYILENLK